MSTFAVRLVLTALLAEASYRWVEMPIRNGATSRAWTSIRAWAHPAHPASSNRLRRWSAAPVAGGLAGVLSILLVSVAIATPPPPPAGMETASIDGLVVAPDVRSPEPARTGDSVASAALSTGPTNAGSDGKRRALGVIGSARHPSGSPGGTAVPASSTTSPAEPTASPTPKRSILAFGESVMIQGAEAMASDLGPVRVDAAVGRHIGEGIEILEERASEGKLAETVIVQLGNNGPFRAGQFDAAMDALSGVDLVVWVNVRVPRDWEAHNNRVIESGIEKYPNARLVDWYDATADRPDLFWKDGYHPRPKGARLYADLIAAAVYDAEAAPQ